MKGHMNSGFQGKEMDYEGQGIDHPVRDYLARSWVWSPVLKKKKKKRNVSWGYDTFEK